MKFRLSVPYTFPFNYLEAGSIVFAFVGQSDETYTDDITLVTTDSGGLGQALPVATAHLQPWAEDVVDESVTTSFFDKPADGNAPAPEAETNADQQPFASGGGGDFGGGGASASFEAPNDGAASSAGTSESSSSSSGSTDTQTFDSGSSSTTSEPGSSDLGSSSDPGEASAASPDA